MSKLKILAKKVDIVINFSVNVVYLHHTRLKNEHRSLYSISNSNMAHKLQN